MIKVTLRRTQTASYEFAIDNKLKAVAIAMLGNEDWTPVEVDDEPIVGRCENCARWLLESDWYSVDEDLIRLCQPCFDAMKTEPIEIPWD